MPFHVTVSPERLTELNRHFNSGEEISIRPMDIAANSQASPSEPHLPTMDFAASVGVDTTASAATPHLIVFSKAVILVSVYERISHEVS